MAMELARIIPPGLCAGTVPTAVITEQLWEPGPLQVLHIGNAASLATATGGWCLLDFPRATEAGLSSLTPPPGAGTNH